MDRISNLCKVLLTTIIFSLIACHPVLSQERIPKGVIIPKMTNLACGDLESLVNYLNDSGHEMVFMGATISSGIFDSLWIHHENKQYVMIRATPDKLEGCMLSNGVIVHNGFEKKTLL